MRHSLYKIHVFFLIIFNITLLIGLLCLYVYDNPSTKTDVEDNQCIVSFIDDDTGKYVPEIWGEIIDSTHIKMGFACITGFMGKESTPISEVFEQMDTTFLRKLYDDGHDVYSHTVTHQEFYVDTVTPERIEWQCKFSKEWLIQNGFTRNADIIVYPGGLGRGKFSIRKPFKTYDQIREKDAKREVIRKYYKYGVDAVGDKVNPDPLDSWSILRVNADTASFYTLKKRVDDAIDAGGLLVFMNHAYELHKDKEAQVKKLLELISYCQQKGIAIMPLSKALEKYGNIAAIGDFESLSCCYISNNGNVKCGTSTLLRVLIFIVLFESICALGISALVLIKKSNRKNGAIVK